MSYLVTKPEDRFSHDVAHMILESIRELEYMYFVITL